jgi:hypothetical protein
VLQGLGSEYAGTWAFVLERVGADATRLVARYRAAFRPSMKMSVMLAVISRIHAFMERKQLRTIKHHAEHARAA